jgi:hypothetical protein
MPAGASENSGAFLSKVEAGASAAWDGEGADDEDGGEDDEEVAGCTKVMRSAGRTRAGGRWLARFLFFPSSSLATSYRIAF